MGTHFKEIVTFRVGRTPSGQYLDTHQGGVTVVADRSPRAPWPITGVRILGTTKTAQPPRWELCNISVVSPSDTTAELWFKVDVPELGAAYRDFNTSPHIRDVNLRNVFNSGGSLEMNVMLDGESVPLTVFLPKPPA